MNIKELLNCIECTAYGKDCNITDITFDSRKAKEGSLFVCLVGFNSDGHNYARSAYENGCRAFLCEWKIDVPNDCMVAVCKDTRAALPDIAAEFYGHPEKELKLIGITGTKGKTTTSWLTYSVLNYAGKKCGYIGGNGAAFDGRRFETANTTPESLILYKFFRMMVDCDVKYVVMEVSSQALAHGRVKGLPFEITAFTNLYEDHIGEGEHPDFDDYKNSKKRLFTEYPARKVIANADDPFTAYMVKGCENKLVTFGIDKKADFNAENIEKYKDSQNLGITFDSEGTNFKLLSPGYFSVYNGLCTIAICNALGVTLNKISEALSGATVDGRFEMVRAKKGVTFIVDYSHNGVALTNALKTLKEYEPKRLICVFGSVGGRTKGRRKELAEASAKYADYTVITADNPDFEPAEDVCNDIASYMPEGSEFEVIPDREEAIKKVVQNSEEGDVVIFAGKGHESYQIIEGKKIPFSEKLLILQYS